MRIPIAAQLAVLVLLCSAVGIAVLAVATWVTTYKFVIEVGSNGLELVATIKASQIASNLDLLESTCKAISTRLLIQAALNRYYSGNSSDSNWTNSIKDLQSALGGGGYINLYQAVLFSRDAQRGDIRLLNVTSDTVPNITLPYSYPDGSAVTLESGGISYPPSLYPNITYTKSADNDTILVHAFPDYPLGLNSALLLGPLTVNSTFSLVSLTLPIVNNTSSSDILGFLTVLAGAENLQNIINSRNGLGNSAQILLLGPSRPENVFASDALPVTATSAAKESELSKEDVHYVFESPPLSADTSSNRNLSDETSFDLSEYPLALKLMLQSEANQYKALSDLTTRNEEGTKVAVGVIRPQSSLVQWILVVEESHKAAFSSVTRLRNIILACVFGTAGFILVTIPLITHWAVAPIRRMRDAAQKSVTPHTPPSNLTESTSTPTPIQVVDGSSEITTHEKRPPSFVKRLCNPVELLIRADETGNRHGDRGFQIPSRVKERRNCMTDELTELTATFNEMSDELTIQYTRLEERVKERTRELEKAKFAAEAANESKTLFIANISHELKTPLNGILGMCAVCMGDDDINQIKKSLQVVYQSGDLLLHLLNDLLTFSKNQMDQTIQLEEKEFRIADIRSQLATIFQKQVHEKHIDFSVKCVSGKSFTAGKAGFCHDKNADPHHFTGLMDMVLWGDKHRILQVLINLVGNSLKFTPEHGKVQVRIRCVRESLADSAPTTRSDDNEDGLVRLSRRSSWARDSLDWTGNINATPIINHLAGQMDSPPLTFQFEVEDNGPGIPANSQKRIFEPFVQGDLGLNRKYGGTGLGLSICAQLSRIMGGQISLKSEEGKGSIFTLKIPLKFIKEVAPSSHISSAPGSRTPSLFSIEEFSHATRAPSRTPSRTPSHAPSNTVTLRKEPTTGFDKSDLPRLVGLSQPFFTPNVSSSTSSSASTSRPFEPSHPEQETAKRIRVLVAEDNAVNQEVVRRMLALEEVYDVIIVKDGQEAFDTVKSNMENGTMFDLIFMDIQMPNLDGLQSTRLIREMGYSAPIVALSAFAEESNIKDCMDSGIDMFISKPIRRPALKQVLNKFAPILEENESSPS